MTDHGEKRPLEALIDALYDEPPQRFVAARNDLVKRLRQGKRKADADALKKLTKAAAPVWLVNRWARRHPALIERLTAAVDRLRAAQTGQPSGSRALAEARTEERAALDDLAESGPKILEAAGLSTSAATVDRAIKTARAAAADPRHRTLLQAGRLSAEVAESGFEGFAALLPPVDVASLQARREATALARGERETARPPVASTVVPARTAKPPSSGEAKRDAEEARRREAERREAEEAQRRRDDEARHRDALRAAVQAVEAQLDDTEAEVERLRTALRDAQSRRDQLRTQRAELLDALEPSPKG